MSNTNNESCGNTHSKFSQKRESQNTRSGPQNFVAIIPLKLEEVISDWQQAMLKMTGLANDDLDGRAS